MVQTPEGLVVRAVVEKVCGTGSRRYAVTRPQDYSAIPNVPKDGTVTFSVSPDIWQGKINPNVGQVVLLQDLQEYSRGWRALKARPSRV